MKEKTLIYLVIVLVVVNVVALGTIIYQRFVGPEPFRRSPLLETVGRGKMMRELRLTDEQREKMRESRRQIDSLVSPLMAQTRDKRHAIFEEMQKDTPDTVTINRLLDEIGAIQSQIEKTMTDNFLRNSRSLTPEQRQIMLRMIEERGGLREGRQMPPGRGPGRDLDDRP